MPVTTTVVESGAGAAAGVAGAVCAKAWVLSALMASAAAALVINICRLKFM